MRAVSDVLYNFHWVVPAEMARSAQAYAGFLGPFLAARGIRGVLNLRGPNPSWRWWHYERRVCAARGILHIDAMLSSKHLPSQAMLVALLEGFDRLPRPFLVKCSGGQDRTSFAAALYLLHRDGWAGRAAAQAQFSRWPYLHLPKPHQRWLRLFIDFAAEEAQGAPIQTWIAEHYRSDGFAQWLGARGLRDTYRDLYPEPA